MERRKVRMWEASCISLAEGLARLVAQQGAESADDFFKNVGLSPAYEAAASSSSSSSSSSLFAFNHLQQQEVIDRDRKRERKSSAARNGILGIFSVQGGNPSRLMESNASTPKVSSSDEFRHAEGAGSAVPASLLSSSQAKESSHGPPLLRQTSEPSNVGWIEKAASASLQAKAMMREVSILERAQIGAGAGGIAGVITYACLHPLDTVKTKLQTRGASHLYSGPLDVIVKTFQNQGVKGFYSGISAVLVGSMFSSAVYFGTCEFGKALLVHVPWLPAVAMPPIAGVLGNLASSAILVPKELITQRMQAGAQGRSWEVFLKTVEKEGFKGLYTGYSAALVRNLPASVLSFSSFEYLKSAWMKKTGKNRLDPWQSVVSGAIAGVISSALTTPLDVVKTRLMTQARTEFYKTTQASVSSIAEVELQAKIAVSTYKGITSTLQKIWVEEGWMGLTKGVLPRILYSACFSALGYFAFETARLALVKRHLVKKRQGILHPC